MKERILIVTSSLDIEWMKGFARFTNEMIKILKSKYDIEVCEINRNRKKEYFRCFLDIPLIEFKSKAKVIVSITPEGAIFTSFIPGKKTIVTFHDFFHLSAKYKNIFGEIIGKIFMWLAYKFSSCNYILVSNSSQTANELKMLFGKESEVINQGVDINRFKPLKFKKLKESIKLGFLSNFSYRKGADIAVEIYNKLKNKINCQLILAGGKLENSLQIQFEFQNLLNDKNVKILGRIPDKDVPKLYNSFDFFLFPSRAEGFGLPILEAAACGIPVFTLKSAHIPEEVKKASIVCKDEDEIVEKIIELSKNKKLYDKIRFEKMKYARKFTWDKCVNEYDKLIQKCFLHK
ncbi:MAG: glycosyltransferase [Candidatus Pacearchaeota archaeon]